MLVNETAIRQWADRKECRFNLPVLVRRLIRETTPALSSLRFPGSEAIDLAGFDGLAENEAKTVWVPKGTSIWEMGCSQYPLEKANSDFSKRTAETSGEAQEKSSFVFVTPRRWTGKSGWLEARRGESSWASVQAYDAIDLETWLEEAPVTSRWLGELLDIADPGLMTPHEWWQRWATVSVPPISQKLVATRRHNEHDQLLSQIRNGQSIISIKADDRKEAMAFVIATMIEADALELLDRTLVATSCEVKIPASPSHLIIIADVGEGNGPDFGDRRNKTIVRPYAKGRFDVKDAIEVSHVPSDLFHSELETLGIQRDDAAKLALNSGCSIPVLRRQLSEDPEIKRPSWARDRATAKRLLPFALAGSWIERENVADNSVLQSLGEIDENEIKPIRDELLMLDDAPIARYGDVNVVVSQLDALFALGPFIQPGDLERFFDVAMLLGGRDPALDLPKDQWWKACLHGKGRNHSRQILSGIGSALCILSVHGEVICGKRLGIDISSRADQFVRSLMSNADEDRWLSIRGHLKVFAETSPRVFLDCIEEDLGKPMPTISVLMDTADGPIGGEYLHSNLLRSLEILAWYPKYFYRVAWIVFELQRFEVKNNRLKYLKSTARSLFRAWLPATTISVTDRMAFLHELSEHYRGPVIDVCISLLPNLGSYYASSTTKPRWRALSAEAPKATNEDIYNAANAASRLLLNLSPFDKRELHKVLEVALCLHPDDLDSFINEVECWSLAAGDDEKAELLNTIRPLMFELDPQDTDESEELVTALRRIESALNPKDPTVRYRWLFENEYIRRSESSGGKFEGRPSFEDEYAYGNEQRRIAMNEIRAILGEDEVFQFALSVKRPELVARALVSDKAPIEVVTAWIRTALKHEASEASDIFLHQVIRNADNVNLGLVYNALKDREILKDVKDRCRLAENLPGHPAGWKIAEELGTEATAAYWSSAKFPAGEDESPTEIEYIVKKLLEYQRPWSAFFLAYYRADQLSPKLWLHIFDQMYVCEEPEIKIPKEYELNCVFEYLDGADDISNFEIAKLELPFVSLLCPYGRSVTNRTLAIHRELTREPALFVQMLDWQFGCGDEQSGSEQEAMKVESWKNRAQIAYDVLKGWNTLPGALGDGNMDKDWFNSWWRDALGCAEEVNLGDVAVFQFGELLARFAKRRSWDDWLPECILELLNQRQNGDLRSKFGIGIQNARGVTTRGVFDGGEQERQLAENYRELSVRMANSYPRVSDLLEWLTRRYEDAARKQDERAVVRERWHA